MNVDRSFIDFGLGLAERALIDLLARDNLQLRPEKMPRTRRARANGRLKQIEQIVRRLMILMAMMVHIVFAPPKSKRKKMAVLPDGVEVAVFPGGAERYFTLLPRSQCPVFEGAAPVAGPSVSEPAGPVPTAQLLARIQAVYRVMKAPDAYVKRLAKSLQRIRAKGEPQPMASPAQGAYRLNAELGALATALPGLLNAALAKAWEDTS